MRKASTVPWLRIVLPLVFGFCLLGTGSRLLLSGAQSAAKPLENQTAPQALTADEQSAVEDAFRSAEGNPQVLIKNLEAFLTRFPHSSRRDLVLRTICTYAMQANAPEVVVQYGLMLLELTPDDPQLLSMLLEALGRQNDQASRGRGIECASRVIKLAEDQRIRVAGTGANQNTPDQLPELIAAIYAQRAGFYRDSGILDKAMADYEKSYATYPSARVAEQLGDASAKKGDSARAIDYYLTAFVFPNKNPDLIHRQEVRRKLGKLYVARHHSEKGLGALVLSRYDALTSQLAERLSGGPPQNAGQRDPFEFVLERMDGTPLPLADYRGKVIVVDFWATWCGPCRMQGKLFEQVAARFRADSRAAFLALNTDEDRSGVPAFLKKEGWTAPVAYAQGLEQLLSVRELPTVVIFDAQGRIVYRQEGVNPDVFIVDLTKHVGDTLQQSPPSPAGPR